MVVLSVESRKNTVLGQTGVGMTYGSGTSSGTSDESLSLFLLYLKKFK